MKIGDVSRRRRFADPVRMRWYAYHRAVRFSRRMLRQEAAGMCCVFRVVTPLTTLAGSAWAVQ
jgi:hypothetical protein